MLPSADKLYGHPDFILAGGVVLATWTWTQEGVRCGSRLLFQAVEKSASIRAASGGLRRKVKSVIAETLGSKLRSDVCFPARRHSHVMALLTGSHGIRMERDRHVGAQHFCSALTHPLLGLNW
ncbi:hypothetical protein AMECASPLE_032789 [Ameca splendens]|uniref:Uncharacterized protein n=1 Tax=Ameca splendens TaxID=208324 RepID=A0ABV1ADY2_9TELE